MAAPQRGGSLTVLEEAGYGGAWPTGLDPGTSTTARGNLSLMNAIFGGLFHLGKGGTVVPDLATGYKFLDGGKTVRIELREGVKFQDGTPFDAQAVAFNIDRDLQSPCTCSPKAVWPGLAKKAVTTRGDHTVELHFELPYASVIHSLLDSSANWIVSPTALKKIGAQKFKIKPVGAGPFKVVSNHPSTELALERNPGYWKKGRPYLDKLTFKSIGDDQAAYQALRAGQGQVYESLWTPAIMKEAAETLRVTRQQSTQPLGVQLNTSIAPFDNEAAREAIYYATDAPAIATHLFSGMFPVTQSFTGPGGLFYQQKVPGYRTYDLAKAKALVKQLGGLSFQLDTPKELVFQQTAEALQSQWAKAGIKATFRSNDLAGNIKRFQTKQWQSFLQPIGAWDPAAATGVTFRFGSRSPYSGVHDPKLDAPLAKGSSTLKESARARIFADAGKYISDHAYAPFLFGFATAMLASNDVSGPGITSSLPALALTPSIPWEEVSVAHG